MDNKAIEKHWIHTWYPIVELVETDYKTATLRACEELKRLVCQVAKHYSQNGVISEDAIQSGYVAIIQDLKDYNLEWSPTTYFKPRIIHEIARMNREESEDTEHYQKLKTKIKQVMSPMIEGGIPQGLAILKTADITGLSPNKIKTMWQQMNTAVVNIDDNQNIGDSKKSPEDQYLENEKILIVRKAFNALDDDERHILIHMLGLDVEKKTLVDIGNEMDLSPKKVDSIGQQALRKLRLNPALKDYIKGASVKDFEPILFFNINLSSKSLDELEEELEECPLDAIFE